MSTWNEAALDVVPDAHKVSVNRMGPWGVFCREDFTGNHMTRSRSSEDDDAENRLTDKLPRAPAGHDTLLEEYAGRWQLKAKNHLLKT